MKIPKFYFLARQKKIIFIELFYLYAKSGIINLFPKIFLRENILFIKGVQKYSFALSKML